MDGELAYYAGRSGLTPPGQFSLDDHKFAYFAAGSGLTPARSYSLSDHQRAFYRAALAGEQAYFSRDDMEYYWWAFAVGDLSYTKSLSDLKRLAIAGNLPPVGPTEQRRNRFLNPAGAGAKSWSSIGNAATTANGTQVAGGPVANARWQKYTLTEAASGTQVIQLAPSGLLAMPVLPNTQYIVSGYALFSAGTITNIGLYQLEEFDAAGNLTSGPFLPTSVVPTAGAWGRDSQIITTASDTAFIRPKMRFLGLNAAIGDYVGVGAVLAETGSTLRSYFDGGFPDGGGNDYQWVSAADDSPSIILA